MKLSDLGKRQKNAFSKEATALAEEYIRKLRHHQEQLFLRYTNDLYKMADKYLGENISHNKPNAKHLNKPKAKE